MNNERKKGDSMLNLTKANALMKKYGYKSKTTYPYVYKDEENIGICFLFEDSKGNEKEKITLFNSEEEMDLFLKKYVWYKENGKEYNVTMKLDKPRAQYPKVIYLRDGIVMEDDEMFNIDKYDSIRTQKKDLNKIDKYLLVAENLLDYYFSKKDEQIALTRKLDGLLEQQRSKYYELQLLVDKYNNTLFNHKKLDSSKRNELKGLDLEKEKDLKKRLSKYKKKLPTEQEAKELIKDIWNLCRELELNNTYYENIKEEVNLENEIKIADKKLIYMTELLKKKSFFRKNLVKVFKKMDKQFLKEKKIISDDLISKEKDKVINKYNCFEDLNILKLDVYLKGYNESNKRNK